MTALSATFTGLLTLADRVLAQVEPRDTWDMINLTEATGGLVLSGNRALDAIDYARQRGYVQPLLPDRQRYRGKTRCPATHPFDPNWISRQRQLGLPVILPDAGYVAEADLEGLRHVLAESAKIENAVALLALANWWLYGAGLRRLLTEVVANPLPLALVIEHHVDPFGVRRILDGVLELLGTGVPVIPLRCDLSALGLMAYGALTAAFGSQTSLRHLYPVRDGNGGGGSRRRPESAIWPAGIALHYSDLLYDAAAATPDDPRWRCYCSICDGDRLDRLSTALVGEIRQHNMANVLDLHSQLTAQAPRTRAQLWKTWAERAEREHGSVSTEAVALKTPQAMINWTRI